MSESNNIVSAWNNRWGIEHDKVLALMRDGSSMEIVEEAIHEVKNLNVFHHCQDVS